MIGREDGRVGRRERARIVLTVLASLVVGGALGAGVGLRLFSPMVAVGLAVIVGIATGLQVRRAILKIRRAASRKGGQTD